MSKLFSYRRILVTSAFPYSNGDLHLGHMLENIQADIWVRYHKFIGNKIYFISSDDSHGTPIMLKAINLKIFPEILIKKFIKQHKNDFKLYSINHNYYGTTHDKYNYRFILKIFKILNNKNLIFKKYINQFYDSKALMFLPDRMIKGICPRCKANNQYGDNCNFCNYAYDAINLINPISSISNTIPEIKRSEHFFFNIPILKKRIFFIINNVLKLEKNILKKSLEWFNYGIKSWNISRDYPYFGFSIPNSNKYFYVWMDATIGYISIFKKFCVLNNINYKDYWKNNSDTELYHFIGKDITYFHILFWPIILDSINFRKPTKIFVHGHLNINNKKISKSSNNYINAKILADNIESDYIRYYFASKIYNNINDINFNIKEFVYVINNNIINKILNLASRNFSLINIHYNGYLSNKLIYNSPYKYFISLSYIIWNLYEKLDFKSVINIVIKLSNIANKYISYNKPWLYINNSKTQDICSIGIYLFKIIIIYLKPIIPKISKFSEYLLRSKLDKNNLYLIYKNNHKINKFSMKFKKLDYFNVKKIFEENDK